MNCPECQSNQTKTIITRTYDDYIRRRRECISCGYRFTTYEITAETVAQALAVKATYLKEHKENDDV